MATSKTTTGGTVKLRHARSVKGKISSAVPLKSILTTSSSSGTHKTTASGFLRHYPALMDPRKLLQLIARHTTADILLWANNGRKLPILSSQHLYDLRKRSIKLMGERTPGGVDTLTKIIAIVKSHNQLDNPKRKFTQIRSDVVCMNAWYDSISKSTTSGSELPLSFTKDADARTALTLLLGNNGTQRVSLVLSELLHDPSFPYCNLEDIPGQVLLEWCASHSYLHVLDKLMVNNPCITTTQADIEVRVESLIRAPALDTPQDVVECTAEDDTMSIDSRDSLFSDGDNMKDAATQVPEIVGDDFRRCGTCNHPGVPFCLFNTESRRPGEVCILSREPCEDRSTRERHATLLLKTFEREYRKRQVRDGHLAEKMEVKNKALSASSNDLFAVRARLYPLLLDEFSGRHVSRAKTSILCLPKKKPDECKILALVDSVSVDLVKGQKPLLSASTLGKENIPADTDLGRNDEGEEVEEDNLEDIIMATCGSLAKHW